MATLDRLLFATFSVDGPWSPIWPVVDGPKGAWPNGKYTSASILKNEH